MRLVFYGGGDDLDNKTLDSALIKLAKNKKPQITYIPSCSYDHDVDFIDFIEQYKYFGVSKFIYFPIDIPYDKVLFKEAFKSDIIHLSGGNTYYFLKYLRQNSLMVRLREFVRKGGILTGLSAGAIIMTPNIATAGFPSFDKDENEENLKNLASLGLVSFEFFPHYRNSHRYDKEIIGHSKKTSNPIYACPDGSGIIVTESTLSFIGKAFCFYKGKKIAIKGNK